MGGSFDEGRGGAPLVLVSDDRGESWESVSLDAALWDGVFGGGVVNATAHGLVFVGTPILWPVYGRRPLLCRS